MLIPINKALKAASQKLTHITETPALEAELLLSFVLNQPRIYIHAYPEQILNKEAIIQYAALIERRLKKEPIPYLTGKKDFWTFTLEVSKDTLIPRPETELLVEAVLSLYDQNTTKKIADLGTGSGALALAIASERPYWQVDATDISQEALQIANKNAQSLGMKHISFYTGNWCTALPSQDYDVIVSNPPYIALDEWALYKEGLKFEPRSALLSGQDGLDDLKVIISTALLYLKPGGYLVLEHGYKQAAAVKGLFYNSGYKKAHSLCDLQGHERVTLAQL